MQHLQFSIWLLSAILILILVIVSSESTKQSLSPNSQLKNAFANDLFLGLEGEYYEPTSQSDESLKDHFIFRIRSRSQQHLSFSPHKYVESKALKSATGFALNVMASYDTTSETEIDPDMSCIRYDQNLCGMLALYGCDWTRTYLNRSNVNVSLSCREEQYARLERKNVLQCRANISALRLRFGLSPSIIGKWSDD